MSFTIVLDNGGHGEIEFVTYLFTFVMSVYVGMFLGVRLNEYYLTKKFREMLENQKQSSESEEESEEEAEETESEEEAEDEAEKSEENCCTNCTDVECFKFTCADLPKTIGESLRFSVDLMKELDTFPSDIGERMKYYETYSEEFVSVIDKDTEFIVRLDGRGFSNLFHSLKTEEFKRLKNPFLNDFKRAMDLTTVDLVKTFSATTGYNHSDEISLHFKQVQKDDGVERNHLFNGRVVKLLTLLSSHASVRFQKHLRDTNPLKYAHVLDRMTFDARHIVFPSQQEVMNYFVWRSQFDCYRNFVSELAYRYFSKKSLEKQSTKERKLRLLDEAGIDVDSFNTFLRYGTFVKRELEKFEKDNKPFWRNVYVRFSLPSLKCEKNYYDLLESKNFQDWELLDVEVELLSKISH
jgi:tRNA(His) 5'-end guanylyltransferase